MMSSAHNRYNLLFRQTHKTQMIHHFALFLFKNYLTIQVGSLQRIHHQYIRYESAQNRKYATDCTDYYDHSMYLDSFYSDVLLLGENLSLLILTNI